MEASVCRNYGTKDYLEITRWTKKDNGFRDKCHPHTWVEPKNLDEVLDWEAVIYQYYLLFLDLATNDKENEYHFVTQRFEQKYIPGQNKSYSYRKDV